MSSDICKELGKRIKELRQRHGWTQTYLAEHLGLDRSYISDLENGKRECGLRNLQVIAKGLDTDLSQLLRDL